MVDAKTRATMRAVAVKFLTDTCTVQRASEGQDTTGAIVKDWHDVATLVPCQLITVSQRRVSEDRGEYYETTYQLRVPITTNIVKGDRIVDVVSEDNAFTAATPIHITAVLPAKAAVAVYLHLDIDYIPGSPS